MMVRERTILCALVKAEEDLDEEDLDEEDLDEDGP